MKKTSTFTGIQCWNPDRIHVVINKEAVSVDRANFLATHVPLDYIRYDRAPRAMRDPGEEGLLQALLASQTHDEHAFVVVRGIPGTGKSHLIRWLKERYEAAQSRRRGSDVVLLIERAQCTLRGSIEQIIRSGIFDDAHMRRQLEKLQGATTELSKQALADNVLAQLQVAAKNELESPTIVERPRGRTLQNLDDFLLDRTIREHLKRRGGPVDRIVRFLASGKDVAMATDEQPGFAGSDFDLPLTAMNVLRQEGYQAAKELAKDLRDHPAWRDELATYLSRLLNVAIGRLTTLTAEDLKEMFSALRRELRQQGRGLALFIEDITAFTGIDRGLVDVLATQHTGEANQQFCRMLSVIGVTDSYYDDSFPTNIKERVTLHLSLNADSDGEGREAHEADLLRDEGARADLAGRYLNAMRLSQEDLDQWLADGADPQRLPNACTRCAFRTPCHTAFGQTPMSSEVARPIGQPIGLYPFNIHALTWLYLGVKGVTQTPRSFLNNVLAYVLHSYGDDIPDGNFPPSPTELSRQFRIPLLRLSAQADLIARQTHSAEDADRVESLLRLWGDRTAYRREAGGDRVIGGLREDVFTAFKAPFIAGEVAESGSIDTGEEAPVGRRPEQQEPSGRGSVSILAERGRDHGVTQPHQGTVSDGPRQIENETSSPHAEDIDAWRRGERLRYYDEYAGRLVTVLRSGIAWDAYGITREEVSEHLQKQHLVFEGQVAQVRSAEHIEFKRSAEMVSVLYALEYLTGRGDLSSAAVTAGHLTRLSAWLRTQEPRIVAFVTNASGNSGEQLNAGNMLLLSTATLEVLYGGLDRQRDTPDALLEAILARASDPPMMRDVITAAEGVRNQAWVNTIQAAAPTQEMWKRLLSTLNRSQGRAADSGDSGAEDSSRRPVYFLDVAPALRTLDALLKSDWELPTRSRTPGGRSASTAPGSPAKLYDDLCARFEQALREEQQVFASWKRDLDEFLGQDSPAETLSAVTELLRKLQYAKHAYPGALDNKPEESVVEAACAGVGGIAITHSRTQLALALSGAKELTKQTRRTVTYFKNVAQFVRQKSASLDGQLETVRGASETRELTEQAQQEYSELERMLARASTSQVDADAVALPVERERRDR